MKDEMYKKVFINGESDLPKEGNYDYVMIKDTVNTNRGIIDLYYVESGNKQYWLTYVDWYLQPLPSSDNVKSAEEIGRGWIMDILEPYACEGNMNITFKDMVELIRTRILPDYASLHAPAKEVTDQDIFDYLNSIDWCTFNSFWDAALFSAKWMREQIKQSNK
jgi:hypothetical protein